MSVKVSQRVLPPIEEAEKVSADESIGLDRSFV